MIIKSYQIKDININKNKFILFYGVNEGFKKEEIVNMKEIDEMGSIVKIAKEIINDIITKVVEDEDPLVEVIEEVLIAEKVEII